MAEPLPLPTTPPTNNPVSRRLTAGEPLAPLVVLMSIGLLGEFDLAAFGVLLPEIRDWFGVSLTTALTLQAVGGLLTLAVAVPVGFYADRINRLRLLSVAMVMFGVLTFLTGLAQSLLMLAIIRLGSGVVRTVGPAVQSVLADYYSSEARTSVFSVSEIATRSGRLIGPIAAGYLGAAVSWQLPFVLVAPLGLFVAVALVRYLREPERGGQERAEAGASELGEQQAPGFSESWRIAKGVRTLRRIWLALPFLVGAVMSLDDVLSLLLADVFDLSSQARGLVFGGAEGFRIAGLVVGVALGTRVLGKRPSTIVTIAGVIGVAQGLLLLVVATAPTWWMAAAPFYVGAFGSAILTPALISLMTLVIPPRARGFALGVGSVFIAPGLLVGPVIGAIGDTFGLRPAVAACAPLFVIGAIIIGSAGVSVEADIRQAKAAASAAAASVVLGDGPQPMLVIRDLDVHYGRTQVLFNVDLDIEEGEVVALLGTNGAGKSTLLRAVSGSQTPSNGAVFFCGEDITHLPPSAHALAGLVSMPGGHAIFPSLTVREHLKLAAHPYRDDAEGVEAGIEQVLTYFPRLRERLDQPAGQQSGGEQQMLALGCAFLSRPKLLMIDELSLGLAPAIVEELLEIVETIHAEGTTVILVEQSINVAFTIATRAVFMEKGEVRFTGPTTDLLDRPDILRAVFLSGGAAVGGGVRHTRTDDVVLEASDLVKAYGGIVAADHVSLELRDGEILGIIGPNGSGKTTLFDLLSGFVEPDSGELHLLGEDITLLGPEGRAALGLHRSFQDARLFPALTVSEAVLVSLEKRLENRSIVQAIVGMPSLRRAEAKARRRAARLLTVLGLEPYRDTFVRELSTGTRRIVDLACILAAEPKVLLLDEPSSGVAQKETEELGPLLQRVRSELGCAIIIIEHDMPLLGTVCDELLALDQGRVITRGTPDDVLSHPQVVEAYLGHSDAAINRSQTGGTRVPAEKGT